MSPIRIAFILLLGLLCCSVVFGQRGGGRGRGRGGGGGGRGRGGYIGGGVGVGRGGGGRRYRSVLYNDDDVYGYEASYPGGEAMYVNYKSSEARAKRGDEFARSSPYSSGGSYSGGSYSGAGVQEKGGRDERDADYGQMY